MLKAREGAELMADLMGTTHLANHYLTRLLRKAGREEWPTIGSGRKDPGLTTKHLMNNQIGHACSGGQPTDAPRRVFEYNLLRQSVGQIKREPSHPVPENPNQLYQPQNFIESYSRTADRNLMLADFLPLLVREAVSELLGNEPRFRFGWPQITLSLGAHGRPLSGEVIEYLSGYKTIITSYYADHDLLPGLNVNERLMPFQTKVVFTRDEFRKIATVAVKTGEYDDLFDLKIASSPSSDGAEGDDGTSDKEAAATDPLPGSDAAAVSDQLAQTELDGHSQSHPKGERENSQPPFQSRAVRDLRNHNQRPPVLPRDWSPQHDSLELVQPCTVAA